MQIPDSVPRYNLPGQESNTPEGRLFVVDGKTGSPIFCWMESRTDAGMLKQDLVELKKYCNNYPGNNLPPHLPNLYFTAGVITTHCLNAT